MSSALMAQIGSGPRGFFPAFEASQRPPGDRSSGCVRSVAEQTALAEPQKRPSDRRRRPQEEETVPGLQLEVDLSQFVERTLILRASDPSAVAETMSAMLAPYQIRPSSPSSPYDTSVSSPLIKTMR